MFSQLLETCIVYENIMNSDRLKHLSNMRVVQIRTFRIIILKACNVEIKLIEEHNICGSRGD